MASLISALIIAIGEWFFDEYLGRHVFDEKHADNKRTVRRANLY